MIKSLVVFENIVRKASRFTDASTATSANLHPFDVRNIHPKISVSTKARDLFDDGHYSQATLEALKFVEKEVQRHAKVKESGHKLMMAVFNETNPIIKLSSLHTNSEIDEQRGFRFIFSGVSEGIRNPRAHEVNIVDTPDKCLDHLALASLLLRRLAESGYE